MKTQDIDDETRIFLTDDLEVGVVVHEEQGDQLRLEWESLTFDDLAMAYYIQQNEPVTLSEIVEEYDAREEKIEEVVDRLKSSGEVYQSDRGEYKFAPR